MRRVLWLCSIHPPKAQLLTAGAILLLVAMQLSTVNHRLAIANIILENAP